MMDQARREHTRRRPRIPLSTGFILALVLSVVAGAASGVEQKGLVLWLDATDASTITLDEFGRVTSWSDKSPSRCQAEQTDAAARPKVAARSIGQEPALRFEGGQWLNLGRSCPALSLKSGQPFTIVALCRVADENSGTLIAQGGGANATRAYHFYLAPGRIGAIVHGGRAEGKCPRGPGLLALVCDGKTATGYSDGLKVLSLKVSKGGSNADVLVGARRETDDNTGASWPLQGDLAELIVYNRALNAKELHALTVELAKKYRLAEPLDAATALAAMKTPADFARLSLYAEELAVLPQAPARLREFLAKHPAAATDVAELLVRIAEKNRLGDELAELAGELLGSKDAFARGLAEWTIAMKVGGENNGQEARWGGADPPAWYRAYAALSHEARVQADHVRQAVSLGIHQDSGRLAASLRNMQARAQRMNDAFAHGGASEELVKAVADCADQLGAVAGKLDRPSADLSAARGLWLQARSRLREIVLDSAAPHARQLVFLKQFAPHTVRNITRSYTWKHKPGGDVCVLEDLRGASLRRVLDGRLGPGYVWGLDLWYDADRVVFSYARLPNWPPPVDTADYGVEGRNVLMLRTLFEPIHVYECDLAGGPVRQLTGDPYWSDFEPTYCPSGDVVFASDRCGRSAECGNDTYDHTNPNLYILSRSAPREGQVRKLTDSKDIDRYPHALDDGSIAYTHWEYQERHFMETHALWTVRPDGRASDALYKHHMRAPLALRDARSVSGTGKVVAIATGHHTFAYGPVVVIDPSHGANEPGGLRVLTPGIRPQEGAMAGQPVDGGGVIDAGGLYQTPWALNETTFLAAYAYARPNCTGTAGVDSNGFGLYVIDVFGNRELLVRDPLLSCTTPIPLSKRPRPPVLNPKETPAPGGERRAVCYVPDVYEGMDPSVARGTIKHIRVAQRVPWPFDPKLGQHDYIPGNAGTKRIDFQDWAPVRVIGTADVETDGSAHFTVPADTALYFQALDERGMEVLRMRSFVSLSPGEVRGCRGCHESQTAAPARGGPPLALRRPARAPEPPAWGGDKLLGYEWLVQPILDRRCTSCHGPKDPDGGIDLSSTRADDGLMQSYRTMFGLGPGLTKPTLKVLVACSDRFDHADVTRPRQFGSHVSPLVRVLLDDKLHREKARLSPAEWTALVTWVDANAPYFDAFLNKRPADGGEPRREILPRLEPLPVVAR